VAASATLRVGCVQLNGSGGLDDVLQTAERLVARAVAFGAQLVGLPEKWNAIGDAQRMLDAGETLEGGATIGALRSWARQHQIWIVGGSISERVEQSSRIRNLSVLVDPEGRVVAAYRKLHLFDVELDGRSVRESATDMAGDELVNADAGGWIIGLSICYDLRFPELYRALAVAGAELLSVPSAFMLHTGRDHWETLLRARAIENGAYVMAPNQHGSWDHNRMLGRSMIIDPWGVVLANAGDGDGICVADIDRRRLTDVRRQLPVLAHRRPDAYARGVAAPLAVTAGG
jgi:deaminated glutathione amidase